MTDDSARKPDRDGIPGVDREGEYKDKDVPPTGGAPDAPGRVGGFEDKDVGAGELGERDERHGIYSDRDVPAATRRPGGVEDEHVPPTGGAPDAPGRVGGFEDKDVGAGELGERGEREGTYADRDVPDRAPGDEARPEGEYKDKDQDPD